MRTEKDKLVKARITTRMKRAIERLARKRDESEAVIVREAIARYIERAKRSGLLMLTCGVGAAFLFLTTCPCFCVDGCACKHCLVRGKPLMRREPGAGSLLS